MCRIICRFSATICAALRHHLPAWICDNRGDLNTFLGLAKRAGCQQEPKVFIMNYDLPPHESRMRRDELPPDSITTIMSVLRVRLLPHLRPFCRVFRFATLNIRCPFMTSASFARIISVHTAPSPTSIQCVVSSSFNKTNLCLSLKTQLCDTSMSFQAPQVHPSNVNTSWHNPRTAERSLSSRTAACSCAGLMLLTQVTYSVCDPVFVE
jgi:hypothetical protein